MADEIKAWCETKALEGNAHFAIAYAIIDAGENISNAIETTEAVTDLSEAIEKLAKRIAVAIEISAT